MIGQLMKACRDCTERNLPECCKGGCEKRDAWMAKQKEARLALQKDRERESIFIEYVIQQGRRR
jgi:hypothetical protein